MRSSGSLLAAVLSIFLLCTPHLSWASESSGSPGSGSAESAAPEESDYDDEYEDDEKAVPVDDTLQPFNRDMYILNDFLILYVLEPVAKGVKAAVPWEFRTIFRNMLSNIRFPARFVNCLLQGKLEKGGDEFAAFFLNTTVGFLGMADVSAAYPALRRSPEDMGQTFAAWGWEQSTFLTLPFFGPSTVRDGLGRLPDTVLDPLFWYASLLLSLEIRGAEAVNDTTFRIGDYEAVKKASLDPYIAIRNGYLQHREKLINE